MAKTTTPNFIQQLREARGWSMQILADRCRPTTSASQINKLEKGQVQLTQRWMERLAAALECHPFDLLDGGPERLKPREREVVAAFRELSETQQAAFHAGLTSLSPSGGQPAKRKPNGASRKTPPPPAKDG